MRARLLLVVSLFFTVLLGPISCAWLNEAPKPRLVMFVGVDVSGSFIQGKDFGDSLTFLSQYLYAHLNGLEGLEKPAALFVGTIGGDKAGQPKVFYPIETFQNKSPDEIDAELKKIFPGNKVDAYTDFNAFVDKISDMVKDRRMVLKPLSIVMLSDGQLDVPTHGHRNSYKDIDLIPLEKLSRNVTIRLLYTNPTVGKKWENEVPRHRVKIWTQEAPVMETWKDPKIFLPATPVEKQDKFLSWVKDNVDYNVRMKRVD